MAIFGDYIEGLIDVFDDFPDVSRVKKIGLSILTVMAIRDEKRMMAFPVVDSYVVSWDGDVGTPDELEQELKEILGESESSS